jgi:hypothetical protein
MASAFNNLFDRRAGFLQSSAHMKATTIPLRHSRNHGRFRVVLLSIRLALACFALSPKARAVCREGCDVINGNTFLGENALLNNIGISNTAVGEGALKSNEDGGWDTAIGLTTKLATTTLP